MTEEEFETSLRISGFLAPSLGEVTIAFRRDHAAMFAIADELNLIGQRQLHRGCDFAINKSTLSPENIGVRLMIRTMSNFQGAMLLLERGMTVEGLTLVRSCHENAFWIAALHRDPNPTLEAFRRAEAKSQDGMVGALQRTVGDLDKGELKDSFKSLLANAPAKTPGSALGVEALAKTGALRSNYAFYKQISANSAHPSLQSVDRYLAKDTEGAWNGFILGPDVDGLADALSLACQATLSALASYGELIAVRSDDDQNLFDLYQRYKALAGIAAVQGDEDGSVSQVV